jgi:hypothetical protein
LLYDDTHYCIDNAQDSASSGRIDAMTAELTLSIILADSYWYIVYEKPMENHSGCDNDDQYHEDDAVDRIIHSEAIEAVAFAVDVTKYVVYLIEDDSLQ